LDLFLKEARLGPVLFLLPDLGDSVHRFRLGRVLVRSAILRVDRGSLVRLGFLRLSGLISLVPLFRLFSRARLSLLVGLCLSLGVRLSRLRREILQGRQGAAPLQKRTETESRRRIA